MRVTREWQMPATQLAYAPAGDAWAAATAQLLTLVEDGEPAATASAPGTLLGALGFTPDGDVVLAAPLRYDRAAREWAAAPEIDPGDGFAIHASAWSPDGAALAVYAEYRPPRGLPPRPAADGPDARLLLWEDGREIAVWEGDRDEPRRALAVGEQALAAGGRAIDVRDRATARPLAVLDPFGALVRALAFDPAERALAAVAADGGAAVWETDAWTQAARWHAHDGQATALAWLRDGRLATAGADGAVRVWSPSGRPVGELALGDPVTALAASPAADELLAATEVPGERVVAIALV